VLRERDLERVSVSIPRLAPKKIPETRGLGALLPLGAFDESATGIGEPSRSQNSEGGKTKSACR